MEGVRHCLTITLVLCFVVGCETTEQLAPPVSQLAISTAQARRSSTTQLEIGRHIYLTRCIECHSLQPVRNYSAERWPAIVQRMARRANLSDSERSQLLAYLLAVKRNAAVAPVAATLRATR